MLLCQGMGKGQSNDPLRAPALSSTLPLRLTRQTGLGGIGGEWWSMHASQGRVRSRGSVSSQRPAPGLDARASTTAATRVAVQSWMTILLFVAQISLSTCINTDCYFTYWGCDESDCRAGKYQLGGHPETVAFALTYLIYVRATCGMEHGSVAACRRGQLVQQRRG
jgi:hypothetical protein